ncbi:DNA repair and recombination protein RAD54B [Blattella germanica]|nr:DNA repair and recombination protein RAD54B [Blattella germanica]
MRRSTAPSLRHAAKFMSPRIDSVPISNQEQQSLLNETKYDSVSENSEEKILLSEPTESSHHALKEIIMQSTTVNSCDKDQLVPVKNEGKRMFNVVWGKQSKKKHKTWEGDGTLEVGLKTVTLKDAEGKIIGQSSRNKATNLEEGSRLYVGSKEVEIIDVLSTDVINTIESKEDTNTNKRLSEPTGNFSGPTLKKSRSMLSKSTFLQAKKSGNKTQPLLTDYKPLVMPSPTHEHQWQYNPDHLPVVDVSVDPCLARVLRPHQRDGVLFIYECIMGMKKNNYHGAILADEMGLGKTLHNFVHIKRMLLKQGPYGGKPILQRVLIVTPSSLVVNWQNEFLRWLGRERIKTFVVDQLLNQLNCKSRLLLTGTPIQNDLLEYYALVNFVNPDILDFKKYYVDPILASRQPSADNETSVLGEQRAKELNHCSNWFILRRTQEVIDKYLPTKQEIVLAMYECAIDYWESRGSEFGPEGVAHLGVITALKKICNHPALVKSRHSMSEQEPGEEDVMQYLSQMFSNCGSESLNQSGKLNVVMSLLQQMSQTREKLVLVSYFTQTLDLMQSMCEQNHYKFCRLDGSTPSGQRMEIVKRFNSPYCDDFIFLLSARAGGVGLNLTGASRLVLYDSDWNPATDLQAMSRIWRDGQSQLLTVGSIEEKIFQRQISKTGLSGAVVDPQNKSSIRLSNEELKDLFTIHRETACLTHEMLNCQCKGTGEVLVKDFHIKENKISNIDNDDLSNHRDCQLVVDSSTKRSSCDIGLDAAKEHITFIFRNSTDNTSY